MLNIKSAVVTIGFLLLPSTGYMVSCSAAPRMLPSGDQDRKAILDVLRKPVEKASKRKVTFYYVKVRVEKGWAWVNATVGFSKGGKTVFADAPTQALLRKEAGQWKVMYDGSADDTSVIYGAAKQYPQAPRAIFGVAERELPPAENPSQAASTGIAMRAFLSAIGRKDTNALLKLVSKKTGFRENDSGSGVGDATKQVSWNRLRDDLKQGSWYWSVFFLERRPPNTDGVTAFGRINRLNHGRQWVYMGDRTYSPPKVDSGDGYTWRYFVQWKREDGKWVIDSIGWPSP